MEQPGTAMTIRVLKQGGLITGPSCRQKAATIHPARIFVKGIKLMLIIVSWVTSFMRQRKDPSVTFTYEATGLPSGKIS